MERDYYWLVANLEGNTYLVYGGVTEEEARQKGFDTLSGVNFEIRKFPTRDQSSASSMLKGHTLNETRSLKKATKRLRHKIKRRSLSLNNYGS